MAKMPVWMRIPGLCQIYLFWKVSYSCVQSKFVFEPFLNYCIIRGEYENLKYENFLFGMYDEEL